MEKYSTFDESDVNRAILKMDAPNVRKIIPQNCIFCGTENYDFAKTPDLKINYSVIGIGREASGSNLHLTCQKCGYIFASFNLGKFLEIHK